MNKLIKFVQDAVQKKTGIILEKEIKILGIIMKKRILVLCGGISKERLISLDTGKQVANELKKNKYKL